MSVSAKPNKVLVNSVEVIELLADEGVLLPAEIAQRTGMARSSVYRLLDALVAVRLAEQVDGSMYRLSRRWLKLADAASRGFTEGTNVQRLLDKVAYDTGLTAFLTVMEGKEVTCIAWAQGSGIELLELRPGRSLPLNAGAAGRCLLAFVPGLADSVIDGRAWPRFTDSTIVDDGTLLQDSDVARRQGFVHSDEDVTPGVGAVGVPVFRKGTVVACLSLGGLADAVRKNREDIAESAKRIADQLIY
jgi:Transcriptional regulator